jgi:hypothetical protein
MGGSTDTRSSNTLPAALINITGTLDVAARGNPWQKIVPNEFALTARL